MMMEACAIYPGSIGEIIQGRLENRDTLLSCPVNIYTKVHIYECNSPALKQVYPKSSLLLENLLSKWGYKQYIDNLDIEINSQIPSGKGFASSTADLCAVYHSLLKLFHREYDEEELIEECIRIEPTDSIIFNKMTLFEYKTGSYSEAIGDYIEFHILVFEGSNIVDTLEFNSRNIPPLSRIDDIAGLLKQGIKSGNVKKIALATTESIIRNQHRLKYDILNEVMKYSIITSGLGILGAHSGDLLGIIYDNMEDAARAAKNAPCIRGYKSYALKTLKRAFSSE
jgi:L-threonine kinase